jgi:nitrogen fixation/metabolism regulation signal transduction histidine kinase
MKQMRLDKINKKIDLKVNSKEMYSLVNSYNNMVTQIDNNVKKLSKSQRELAWREMAKQVAHEIKNPLTPMKLSVQNFKLKFDPNDPKMISKVNEFSKTII